MIRTYVVFYGRNWSLGISNYLFWLADLNIPKESPIWKVNLAPAIDKWLFNIVFKVDVSFMNNNSVLRFIVNFMNNNIV